MPGAGPQPRGGRAARTFPGISGSSANSGQMPGPRVSTGKAANGTEGVQLQRGAAPRASRPRGPGQAGQGGAAAAWQAPPLPRQRAGGPPRAQRLPGVPGRAWGRRRGGSLICAAPRRRAGGARADKGGLHPAAGPRTQVALVPGCRCSEGRGEGSRHRRAAGRGRRGSGRPPACRERGGEGGGTAAPPPCQRVSLTPHPIPPPSARQASGVRGVRPSHRTAPFRWTRGRDAETQGLRRRRPGAPAPRAGRPLSPGREGEASSGAVALGSALGRGPAWDESPRPVGCPRASRCHRGGRGVPASGGWGRLKTKKKKLK